MPEHQEQQTAVVGFVVGTLDGAAKLVNLGQVIGAAVFAVASSFCPMFEEENRPQL